MNLGAMHRPGGDHVGIARLEVLVRLALDDEVSFAFQQVPHFYAWMRVASGAAAGRDFSNPGDGIVAVRKLAFFATACA